MQNFLTVFRKNISKTVRLSNDFKAIIKCIFFRHQSCSSQSRRLTDNEKYAEITFCNQGKISFNLW